MKKRQSFTLIELLVTIGVIVILAGISIGIMNAGSGKSTEADTRARMKSFEMALEKYKTKYGHYPVKAAGTDPDLLAIDPADAMWKKFKSGDFYDGDFDKLVDGKGLPFFYCCPGKHNKKKYDLWSMGPDGNHGDAEKSYNSNPWAAPGDVGSDDICNWNQQ